MASIVQPYTEQMKTRLSEKPLINAVCSQVLTSFFIQHTQKQSM